MLLKQNNVSLKENNIAHSQFETGLHASKCVDRSEVIYWSEFHKKDLNIYWTLLIKQILKYLIWSITNVPFELLCYNKNTM